MKVLAIVGELDGDLNTRSSSPWMSGFTVLPNSSRIILEIFFASSWLMPSLSEASRRYSLPESWGSLSPRSRAFSETLRLISLVWKTSRTASTRSCEFAFIRMLSPLLSMEAPTFLKSYR